MSTRLGADLQISSFGMLLDAATQRLDFPRAHVDALRGSSGSVEWAAREVTVEKLHTLLDRGLWRASSASAAAVLLRTADGALSLGIDRVELNHGLTIGSTAEGGVEILAPSATLHDVTITLPTLGALTATRAGEVATEALAKAADVPLRQEKLRVLDSLNGEIRLTVKVVLDLPVLGTRTLDQQLRIPIKDGSLDYRALDDSLDWLEGSFLDLDVKRDRLVLSWRVPVFGRSREIISFQLDMEGQTTAVFDRVPLRAFADYRLPEGAAPADKPPAKKGKELVRSLTLSDLSIDLSMAAPRSVDIGDGTLRFGGDDEPGVVGLSIAGSLVHPPGPRRSGGAQDNGTDSGPGGLTGRVALLDVTAKDLALGPTTLTVDRLHLGSIDPIDLRFDGFTPTGLTAHVHRITATNLSLRLS